MNEAYRNLTANAGAAVITHIGLVQGGGVEISGSPYVRKAVTWTAAVDGEIQPTDDLLFEIPTGGVTVAGWHGYSAVSGGTDYGGGDLTPVSYGGAGYYVLTAEDTAIQHNEPS